MYTVSTNPMLGVSLHSVGAACAANCYTPQKFIKHWSWEIFWLVQAAWCWLLWPIIGVVLTIPNFVLVLAEAPKLPMLISFLMGIAYGVGGTAFNISIRYIGFSLTYAIAVGLSSVLGTIIPPLVRGQLGLILAKPGAGFIVMGVAVGALGIGLCGISGRLKELDLQTKKGGTGEFFLMKGMLLSLLAGVLSAVYGFSLEAAVPIVEVAEKYGAGQWKGNIAYLFSNPGAFLTAMVYSLYLAKKNKSLRELLGIPDDEKHKRLALNYSLAIFTGTLWYGQFFFYNLGHVRMGHYEFTSWGLHMIMLVLISNVVGVMFREWKDCRRRTQVAIGISLLLLAGAVLLLTYGNYIGDKGV